MSFLTSRWGARLCAVLAGLAAGLAHPPFGVLPGLLGYAVLLHLANAEGPRPLRQAFFRGWLAGVGYFAISVWWVVEAFLVDAATYGWMAPFALLFMASGLALFWGAATLLYRAAAPRGWARPLAFAGALALLEFARGHVLTGFPWNLPGEAWRAGSAPSQAAALVGAYGLSWITVLAGCAPALAFEPGPWRRRIGGPAAALALVAALYGYGTARLAGALPRDLNAPLIRIVQANIDQKEKWRPENLDAVFRTYVELSDRPAAVRPQIVVWPEGALPAVINDLLAPGLPYVDGLARAFAPGQTLMMGANRAELRPNGEVAYFNSLVSLHRDEGGFAVAGVYDKHTLVPFGEYLPLGPLATRLGFRSLVHMPEDFTAGGAPKPIAADGAPPLQPLICYEALFPRRTSEAARRSGVRPGWMLNASNDAWFGMTSGPLQHLNLASYRAIEEGLPIIRATPTGVSAVVDAYGRVAPGESLGLGKLGVIDARLPPALRPTPYSRFGEGAFALMLLISGATAAISRVRRS